MEHRNIFPKSCFFYGGFDSNLSINSIPVYQGCDLAMIIKILEAILVALKESTFNLVSPAGSVMQRLTDSSADSLLTPSINSSPFATNPKGGE